MEEVYVIFNPALGVHDFVTVDDDKTSPDKKSAWLEDPYDMVGPFDLNELIIEGKISFAKCFVMSKKVWRDERIFLQKEAFKKQQKIHKEYFNDETKHRKLLCLPVEGELEVSQIKAAYRKIIKKVHPDVGGSHEEFIEITLARDTLLEK